MYMGRIVELGSASDILAAPRHPYAQALLGSVLTPEPELDLPELSLGRGFPDPLNPPTGCSFHPRCVKAFGPCAQERPKSINQQGHLVECHLHDMNGQQINAQKVSA